MTALDSPSRPYGDQEVSQQMAEETETLDRSSLPSPEEALRALDESEYSETEFDDLMSLYEDTMTNIQQGEIVEGTVLAVDDNSVVIDIGFKSEGSVPLEEFGSSEEIEVGQQVEVFLETVEDQEGQIVLSKTKADFMLSLIHISEPTRP